jgi:BirA family transcriptional regulator, biotin operon repressor / biotin---[acetyl-CoA-carboxylase] ligase
LKSIRSESLPPEFADALDRARDRLGRLGSSIFYFPTIGSTNDVAASIATDGAGEGAIVIADAQSAGRGRRGRAWFSPPGVGLYVSVILAPQHARGDPERATTLVTLAAGVALAEGIAAATGLAPDIKWPNDLRIGRRKVSGILAEGINAPPVQAVVLGYGINVGPMSYPPELADRATSLETELGRPIDRASVCAETLAALSSRYDDLLDGRFDAILDAWRHRAPSHRGARVSWQTGTTARTGTTAGIDDSGALLVRVGERIEKIIAGEVTWL